MPHVNKPEIGLGAILRIKLISGTTLLISDAFQPYADAPASWATQKGAGVARAFAVLV